VTAIITEQYYLRLIFSLDGGEGFRCGPFPLYLLSSRRPGLRVEYKISIKRDPPRTLLLVKLLVIVTWHKVMA